jgi:hypothetical protein
MSLLDPRTREEVDTSGWIVVTGMLAAVFLAIGFWNRFFLTPEAVVYLTNGALVAGPVLGWLVHRRSRRIAERGIHPQFSKRFPPPAGSVFGMVLAMVPFAWLSGAIGMAVLSPLRTAVSERVFTIVDTHHCTRKCIGCFAQVRLLDWPGVSTGRVCGDRLPNVAIGTKVVVTGNFEGLVIRVDGVRPWAR